MYVEQEDIFYYITVMNEPWEQPEMPPGVRDGILKGMYRYKSSAKKDAKLRAQLMGSGAILLEVLRRRRFWKAGSALPPMCGA